MNNFPVWIRPLLGGCRVRVETLKNAQWLLNRLSQCFVFKTSEAIHDDGVSSFTFQVLHSSQTPRPMFEKLLAAIPEVNLMMDPA